MKRSFEITIRSWRGSVKKLLPTLFDAVDTGLCRSTLTE
ncbi:hypothetical protein PJE062_3007 [Pseudovibrio sp. JE062]|nr:hypothetical protein PJE062_3007 [Pseudovibrio sp. JE062]